MYDVSSKSTDHSKAEFSAYIEGLVVAYPDFALEVKHKYFARIMGGYASVLSRTDLGLTHL